MFASMINSSLNIYDICRSKNIGGLPVSNVEPTVSHLVGGNRKCYQQSTIADQKSIETVFLVAICRQCGDKWQS